jgi:hypothetical protein
LIVDLDVPESGDDVEAVVDGVSASAALPHYLPVLEPGDDAFDAGPDPTVRPYWSSRMIRPVVSRRGVLIVAMPR